MSRGAYKPLPAVHRELELLRLSILELHPTLKSWYIKIYRDSAKKRQALYGRDDYVRRWTASAWYLRKALRT